MTRQEKSGYACKGTKFAPSANSSMKNLENTLTDKQIEVLDSNVHPLVFLSADHAHVMILGLERKPCVVRIGDVTGLIRDLVALTPVEGVA